MAPETVLTHKPETLTFAEASTLPQAGAIALSGTARVAAGQRMLINGAGGGPNMAITGAGAVAQAFIQS